MLFEGAGEEIPAAAPGCATSPRSRRRRPCASRGSPTAHLALRPLRLPLLRRARGGHAARAVGRVRRATGTGRAVACTRPRSATRCTGCSSSSTSRRPSHPTAGELARSCSGWYPGVSEDELQRIGAVRAHVHRLAAGRPDRRAQRSAARSGRSRSSSTACSSTAGSTSSGSRATARSSSTTRPTPRRARAGGDRRGGVRDAAGPCTRSPACAPGRRRSRSSTTSSRRRTRSSRRRSPRTTRRGSRPASPPRSRAIRAGEFRPTPSPFACSGCPALDVVCAGPRLGGSGDKMSEPVLASAQ